MPGPRWHRTLIAFLAVAALLAAPVPALAQDDRSAARAALVPDDLWTSERASTLGPPSDDGGGWSIPILLAALAVAYGAGLLAANAARVLPAAEPRPHRPTEPLVPPTRMATVEARHAGDEAWFTAVAPNSHATPAPVAQSRSFRMGHDDDPDRTVAAAAAHAALLADLEAAGWEPSGSAGPWYATTLRRRP